MRRWTKDDGREGFIKWHRVTADFWAKRLPWRVSAVLLALFLHGAAQAAEGAMDRYFTTSDGLKIHYLEAGSGSGTIVFVPGWLMPAAIFEKQLTALSRDFRVLAFDPRSQGHSGISPGDHGPEIRMRDLDEFRAAAQVGDFVLAGWSLGVLEVLDYIEKYQPAGLKGVVLIDNSIGEGTPPPPRPASFQNNLAIPERRTRYLTDFCSSMFHRTPPEPVFKAVLSSALRVPPAAARQTISQPYPRTYWRNIVARLEVPVLYAITPRLREQADALQRRKGPQRAAVEIFEKAGHALFVDDAERFNGAVERFARRAFGENLSP